MYPVLEKLPLSQYDISKLNVNVSQDGEKSVLSTECPVRPWFLAKHTLHLPNVAN